MITEQDVIEYLNKATKESKELKPATQNYIRKLKELEKLQGIQQEDLGILRANLASAEETLQRTRGAISVVLELVAEEEGLLSADLPATTTPSPEQSDD